MFDLIPVLEVVGMDNKNRTIRTLGYVEQLYDGTLKVTVHCDTVPEYRRVYSASVCEDCTPYPTGTLASILADMLETVGKHVSFMLWYTPCGDGKTQAPNLDNAIVLALHKYGVTR